MNKIRSILILTVIVSMISCNPPVTFDEPQPAGVKNIQKFPNRLQGEFLSMTDNSLLTINDHLIQRIYNFDNKININELDSNFILAGDTLIDLISDEKTLVKRVGDSLINHVYYVDTLFEINQGNVVRKFKGFYFINKLFDKGMWEVKKIQLLKGQLIISKISTKNDLDNLRAITETPMDTIYPYKIKATKKQFKHFVKSNGFSDSETFILQKK